MKVKNLSFSYNQKSFIKDLNIEFIFKPNNDNYWIEW